MKIIERFEGIQLVEIMKFENIRTMANTENMEMMGHMEITYILKRNFWNVCRL